MKIKVSRSKGEEAKQPDQQESGAQAQSSQQNLPSESQIRNDTQSDSSSSLSDVQGKIKLSIIKEKQTEMFESLKKATLQSKGKKFSRADVMGSPNCANSIQIFGISKFSTVVKHQHKLMEQLKRASQTGQRVAAGQPPAEGTSGGSEAKPQDASGEKVEDKQKQDVKMEKIAKQKRKNFLIPQLFQHSGNQQAMHKYQKEIEEKKQEFLSLFSQEKQKRDVKMRLLQMQGLVKSVVNIINQKKNIRTRKMAIRPEGDDRLPLESQAGDGQPQEAQEGEGGVSGEAPKEQKSNFVRMMKVVGHIRKFVKQKPNTTGAQIDAKQILNLQHQNSKDEVLIQEQFTLQGMRRPGVRDTDAKFVEELH